MRPLIRRLLPVLTLLFICGCSSHNVKYRPLIRNEIPSAPYAIVVHGTIDEAAGLMEQSRLPHNTPRKRYELQRQADAALMKQLGSEDYLVIGEIFGSGSSSATLPSLEQAMCKEAAEEGGDVVLIYNSGIIERPYVYESPGYASTYFYGSSSHHGRCGYGYGYGRSWTTYTPGTVYSGVLYLPAADGLVLRHVAGIEAMREALGVLSDPELDDASHRLERLMGDDDVTFDEMLIKWDRLIQRQSSGVTFEPGSMPGMDGSVPPAAAVSPSEQTRLRAEPGTSSKRIIGCVLPMSANWPGWGGATPVSGGWTPSPEDLKQAEPVILQYIHESDRDIYDRIEDYRCQFVGYTVEGKKRIYCNFFDDEMGKDWRTEPIIVLDGGDSYFQLEYDMETNACLNFSVNGEA